MPRNKNSPRDIERSRQRFRQHQAKLRMRREARNASSGWTFNPSSDWDAPENQREPHRDSFTQNMNRPGTSFKPFKTHSRPPPGPAATRDRRERRLRKLRREQIEKERQRWEREREQPNQLGRYIVQYMHNPHHTGNQVSTGPFTPPAGAKTIDQILEKARSQLTRVLPFAALEEYRNQAFSYNRHPSHLPSPRDSFSSSSSAPVIIVDIRPPSQRDLHGELHGTNVYTIGRNVLEWRLDPQAEARLDIANRYDLRIFVLCQEGYTSSLAATALHELGLHRATDIEGGFRAWKEGGLPLDLD